MNSIISGADPSPHQLQDGFTRIRDQRRTSLQAHYAGALPLDLLNKEEQDRLARQLDLVTARLDALDSTYDEARTHVQECLASVTLEPSCIMSRVQVRRVEWS